MPETIWDKLRRWAPWAVVGRARLLVRRWWRRRACRRLGGCVPGTHSNGWDAVCLRCHYVMGHHVAWLDDEGVRHTGIHVGRRRVRFHDGSVVRVEEGFALIPMDTASR